MLEIKESPYFVGTMDSETILWVLNTQLLISQVFCCRQQLVLGKNSLIRTLRLRTFLFAPSRIELGLYCA